MSVRSLFIKLFGVKSDTIYYVDIRDIIVPMEFRKCSVGKEKMERKKKYYLTTGNFESHVILKRKNFRLVDGYTTYLLCQYFGQKVPVQFVD